MKSGEEANKCPLQNPADTGSQAVEGSDVVLEIKPLGPPGLNFDP